MLGFKVCLGPMGVEGQEKSAGNKLQRKDMEGINEVKRLSVGTPLKSPRYTPIA